MAELIIQSGKLAGKKLVLPPEKSLVVGRGEECQVRLPSSLVSRQHCRISAGAGGIVVEDLGSQNGTLVNEVAITGRVVLKPGDTLRIGAMIFAVPAPKAARAFGEPLKDASDADIAAWLDEPSAAAAGDTADFTPEAANAIRQAISEVSEVQPKVARIDPIQAKIGEIIRQHWAERRKKS